MKKLFSVQRIYQNLLFASFLCLIFFGCQKDTLKDDVVKEGSKTSKLSLSATPPVLTTRNVLTTVEGTTLYTLTGRNGYFFSSGMTIDADGSPHAYNPSNTGLDYLANAGSPGNWWGIATDANGNPYIQRSTDPVPGYYVSVTSLVNSAKVIRDPLRYVDSETIPYIALPNGKAQGAKVGDYCVIYNKKNDKYCYGIFADVGPANHIGEASMKAAELLGIPNSPKNGGQSNDVVYVVFPNSGAGQGTIPSYATIQTTGAVLFDNWGGIEQLRYFYYVGTGTTIDGFEGTTGHFNSAPTHSGSTAGIATTSTTTAVTTVTHSGTGSLQVKLLDNTTLATNWSVRLLSGLGTPANNVLIPGTKTVSFWLKTATASAGATVQIWIDDTDGTEASPQINIINDGLWHIYSWSLPNFNGTTITTGNGIINGANVTLDAIMLKQPNTATTWTINIDDLKYN